MRLNFLPSCPAIRGAVQPASRAAAIHAPGSAPSLPERCEQNIGVARIESDVNRAGLGILVQDFLPSLAAVASAKDSALFIVGEGMSQSRNEGNVRILRVHDQAADRLGVR